MSNITQATTTDQPPPPSPPTQTSATAAAVDAAADTIPICRQTNPCAFCLKHGHCMDDCEGFGIFKELRDDGFRDYPGLLDYLEGKRELKL